MPIDSKDSSLAQFGAPEPELGSTPIQLDWDGSRYDVLELDQYGFEVDSVALAERFDVDADPETFAARLAVAVGGDADGDDLEDAVAIEFRIRRVDGIRVRVGFYDLSIQSRERLARIEARNNDSSKDELHHLSYDDLAKGGSSGAKATLKSAAPKAGFLKKIVAVSILAGSMILVVGWVVYMIQSRSTVAVSNSVMMGNYFPVNSPQQAQLTEVLVKAGQVVRRGETLARLSNELAVTELQLVEAKLQRARSEVLAYHEEARQLEETFRFTELKIARDLSVAEAELGGNDAQLAAAEAQLTRLRPLIARNRVIGAELDEATVLFATAKAEKLRQAAVIESLKFVQEAARSKILVNENGASNPMSELRTKIALAEAAAEELSQSREVLKTLAKPVELFSPADGSVYAIYRRAGETLKVADQLIAISAEEGGWAIGHVADYLAPEIRPGHHVEIEFPSLGITADGTIKGIGHRSVYERGGYNADFRGGPLDVPIRVAIDLGGQPIPTGMRLNMTVRVKDPLKDLKSWVNRKVARYWPSSDAAMDVKVAMSNQ